MSTTGMNSDLFALLAPICVTFDTSHMPLYLGVASLLSLLSVCENAPHIADICTMMRKAYWQP